MVICTLIIITIKLNKNEKIILISDEFYFIDCSGADHFLHAVI